MMCPKCGYEYPDGCDVTCDYRHPVVEWISVKDKLPDFSYEGKSILVVVKGIIRICEVMEKDGLYISTNRFLFKPLSGWKSDPRFADPTHWMPLPEPPQDISNE